MLQQKQKDSTNERLDRLKKLKNASKNTTKTTTKKTTKKGVAK